MNCGYCGVPVEASHVGGWVHILTGVDGSDMRLYGCYLRHASLLCADPEYFQIQVV